MSAADRRWRTDARGWRLAAGAVALLALVAVSLITGPRSISLRTAIDAFIQHDPGNVDHIIVTTTRLARTAIAVAVGASLAVAGALMQALTRNPLASPSLFGVNAGAMFFLVALAAFAPPTSFEVMMGVAFAGAATAGALVYALGTTQRAQAFSLRIVLAGAAVTALFAAFTQAILVVNQDGLDSILFWLAGSTAERSLQTVVPILPFAAGAIVAAIVLARHVDVLAAGDDIAVSLGQRTAWVKAAVAVAIVCLAGGAVAMAGSIGFVGLIVPHMVRRVLSADHRWLLPGCAVFGALLLLGADVLSRVVIAPGELPIGAITAMIGAPVFVGMVRRGLRHA